MIEEIEAACQWWVSQLRKSVNQQAALDAFYSALVKELEDRFKGHWYEENPVKGSGFRSISYDHHLDTVITKAAESAGLKSLEKLFVSARHCVVYVNPGEVKVRNYSVGNGNSTLDLVFKRNSNSHSNSNVVNGTSSNGSSSSPSGSASGSAPSSPNTPPMSLTSPCKPANGSTSSALSINSPA